MIAPAKRSRLAAYLPFPAIFAATLAMYASTRSISLDDWDSVNFARAIVHFDLRLQQPHPPGYPAYVFFARLVDGLTRDPLAALTWLSALCGAVCVVAFFGLSRDLGAGWAAFPLAALPLFWLNSGMAMSDVPGLAFAVLSVWLLNRATIASPDVTLSGERRIRAPLTPRCAYLLAGCAVAGIGAGVRPQDVIVPLSVLVLFVAPQLWSRDATSRRDLALGVLVFVAACLTWAIPLAISLGPLPGALQPFRQQVRYVRAKDLLGSDGVTPAALKERLAQFGQVFSAYFGGPQEGGFVAFIALAAAVAFLAAVAGRCRATWLALVWLLPYGALMLLAMQPDDPRKVLPALPPLFLLLAAASLRFTHHSLGKVGLALGIGLTGIFAAKSLPLVHALDTQMTPPQQAVALIASRYSPDDTVIFAGNSVNHLYYLLPGYNTLEWDFISDDDFNQIVESGDYRNVIVLDVQDPGDNLGPYARVETIDLERDWRVLPKASYVPMTIYEHPADSSLANASP